MVKRLLYVELDLESIRIIGLDEMFASMVLTPDEKVSHGAPKSRGSSSSKDLLSMADPRRSKPKSSTTQHSHNVGAQLQICQPCKEPSTDFTDDVGQVLGIWSEDYTTDTVVLVDVVAPVV